MANGDDQKTNLRMMLNLKGALAFFLVGVAALMVLIWMLRPPRTGADGVDAGTVALIASMITLFIKMAADAVGFQFNSSAGSEKKDEVQAGVSAKLADKVASAPGAPPTVPVPPWWRRLTDTEKNAITTVAAGDARVAAFVTASQVGAATKDDLDYLVTKGLLTQDRATAIAAP
jgi:hypothetical protein